MASAAFDQELVLMSDNEEKYSVPLSIARGSRLIRGMLECDGAGVCACACARVRVRVCFPRATHLCAITAVPVCFPRATRR